MGFDAALAHSKLELCKCHQRTLCTLKLIICGMQCEDFQALSKVLGRSNVKHPLLDKVRRCSAEPEAAAQFFGMVLFPGVGRASAFVAQRTPYFRSLRQELTEHYERNPPKPCKHSLVDPVPSNSDPYFPTRFHFKPPLPLFSPHPLFPTIPLASFLCLPARLLAV